MGAAFSELRVSAVRAHNLPASDGVARWLPFVRSSLRCGLQPFEEVGHDALVSGCLQSEFPQHTVRHIIMLTVTAHSGKRVPKLSGFILLISITMALSCSSDRQDNPQTWTRPGDRTSEFSWSSQDSQKRRVTSVLTMPAKVFSDSASGLYLPGLVKAFSGGLLVVDYSDFKVKWIDFDGQPVREFGSRGEGPGQFEAIQDVALVGDSLLIVVDSKLRRTTIFALSGELRDVRSWKTEAPGGVDIGVDGTTYYVVRRQDHLLKISPTATDTSGVLTFTPGSDLAEQAMVYQSRISTFEDDVILTFLALPRMARLDRDGRIVYARETIGAHEVAVPEVSTSDVSGMNIRMAPRLIHGFESVDNANVYIGSRVDNRLYFLDVYAAGTGDYLHSIDLQRYVRYGDVFRGRLYACVNGEVLVFDLDAGGSE